MELCKNRKIALSKGDLTLKVDNIKKQVLITLTGQHDEETVQKFFNEYVKHTSNLDKSKFDLLIDSYLLGVIKPHLLDGVAEAYKCYRDFKSVTFINPMNIVGKVQLTRIAKENGYMDFFKFVDR